MNHILVIFLLTFTFFQVFISCSKTPTGNENNYFVPWEKGNTIDTEPDWSPDGNRIAYTHLPQDSIEQLDGPYQIWILNLDSMHKEFITMGYLPDWSPDGNKIAYVRNTNIYSIEIDTRQVIQLTDWGECFFPSWSPDGKKIAFDTNHNDPRGSNAIWIMDADGSNKTDISVHGTGEWREPAWSLDTLNILHLRYISYDNSPAPELFIMDTTGENPVRVTYNYFNDRDADWSPDGKYIAWGSYGSGKNPKSGIWTMNADGSDPHQITSWGGYPSWSPDGSHIVYYQNYDDSTGTLWIMNADGTDQRPLTTP
jgi:TolB protein